MQNQTINEQVEDQSTSRKLRRENSGVHILYYITQQLKPNTDSKQHRREQ